MAKSCIRERPKLGHANDSGAPDRAKLAPRLLIRGVTAMRFAASVAVVLLSIFQATTGNAADLKSEEVYAAWLQMYDLKFEDAHRILQQWQRDHPEDPLGPASDAAAYLFSELTRLGALETQLFVDDNRFKTRRTWEPDTSVKGSFDKCIEHADQLADAGLQNSSNDPRSLFVKSLTYGLKADYVALIEGSGLRALGLTKTGRVYANRLMAAQPLAYDAYLGPGVENYLLSLKPVALRVLLRFTGSEVDREKGLSELRKTADNGYYLEPFAKLLLAVVALRDNDLQKARDILTGLHQRFPDNQLYSLELSRLTAATP